MAVRVAAALWASLLWASSLKAQIPWGEISGEVFGFSGKPLSGAAVELENGPRLAVLTNEKGQFSFHFLPPAIYRVSFSHPLASQKAIFEIDNTFKYSSFLKVRLQEESPWTWSLLEQRIRSPSTGIPEKIYSSDLLKSLPTTLHLATLLGNTEISAVAERLDGAGLHSDESMLLGARGSSWSQNETRLNGLALADLKGNSMASLPDLPALQTINYGVGNSWMDGSVPGIHLELTPKTGSEEVHGQGHFFFQSGALQSVNVTERHRSFGITQSDERFRHFFNGNFQLGGPIAKTPWTYFGSFSTQNLEKWVRNHPLPVSSTIYWGTLNLLGPVSITDQLGILWTTRYLRRPQAGASAQVAREATSNETQVSQILQGSWTRYLSSRSLLDVRLGVAGERREDGLQPGVQEPSREELFPGFAIVPFVPSAIAGRPIVSLLNKTETESAPLAVVTHQQQFESSLQLGTFRQSFWNSTYRLSLGGDYHFTQSSQQSSSFNNINLLFFQGMPNSVRLLNTPTQTRDRIHQKEVHASNHFALARFSLDLGVNAAFQTGLNSVDGGVRGNRLGWSNLSRRAGVAFQIRRKWPLLVRGAAGPHYHRPPLSLLAAVNPNGVGVRLYSWKDLNHDKQFQMEEIGQLLKVYGAPYNRMDGHLKSPFTNEVMISLSQEIPHYATFSFSGFRRVEHHLLSLLNVGIPLTAYTPVEIFDPGEDGAVATGDEHRLIVFNQKSETLGHDSYLLTNPPGHSGFYEGVEIRLLHSGRRWLWEAAYTKYRAVSRTAPGNGPRQNDQAVLLGAFDDPNKSINAYGSTFFDRGRMGKLWGIYNVGWRTQVAWIANYQDGVPYGRYLPVTGLNQGLIGILATRRGPGTGRDNLGKRTASHLTMDLRCSRSLDFGRSRLDFMVDVYNLLNSAHALREADVTSPNHLWRIPLMFQTPRSVQLGMRLSW
ncbi:MAG: hypothetical protein DMG05_00950 [Acidobacteria bacterium]|nr:MAG: hypothetical protein DMG05_00950 [Acidobacteriota bacterium]